MKEMCILTDVTRCIGCEKCVTACKELNQTGTDRFWSWQHAINDLSASRWTTIVPKPNNVYVRQQCRHCLHPACVSVCPVGALKQTPEGAVIYDSKICMGCRYCMMACPYGIPRYIWSDPIPYVRKCIMCYDHIKKGTVKEPACTAVCPTQATVFGERTALLEEAHRRLRDNPERYRFQKVWGEDEVGGTSVLYLSNIDLSFLGWKPDLGNSPLPLKTWATLQTVPYTFAIVGAAMFGIHKVIERRMEMSAAETVEKENGPSATSDHTPSQPTTEETKE